MTFRRLLLTLALLTLSACAQSLPQSQDNYFDAHDARLWYQVCGSSGTNVVLLHDGLVHSITWDHVWPKLCTSYHVLRYDRRGYGHSAAATSPFVPEDDLVAMMNHAGMKQAIVAGISSGGGLALDFAVTHPEMVQGLFLVGPVVHGMSTSKFVQDRGEANNAPLEHGDVKAAARTWSRDPYILGDNQEARKELYEVLTANPQNFKVPGYFEIRPFPSTAVRLSEIQAPTLVIAGSRDIPDVHAYCGAIEAALPVVAREVWPNAGHLIELELPAELVARFDRFVKLTERKEISLSSMVLRRYAGQYKVSRLVLTVSLDGNRLVLHNPGSPDQRLFAASESRFFLRSKDVEIDFQKDLSGNVTQMLVHNSDGSQVTLQRI
jgi:pimeloyl-ACP methyl ester carboxylesterase